MQNSSAVKIDLFGKKLPDLSEIESLVLTVNSAEFNRARFHVAAEEYAEAGHKDTAIRCGIAYWIAGKYAKAVVELEQAADDGYKFFFLGRTYKALGRYKDAVDALEKASTMLEVPTPAELERISALILAKNFEQARSKLNTLGKVLSGKSADYHYYYGKLFEALGDYEQAIAGYEKAISIDDRHVESMFALAYMLDLHGNDTAAMEFYKATTQINPLHVNALLNMSVIYEDNEDYDNAINCISIVLRHHPNHPRARLFKKDVQSATTMLVDEEQEKKTRSRSKILEKPITDYELSVRSRNCLKKMNINTVGDLLKINESELLSYKNFGETSLTEIRCILEAEGLRLGMFHDEEMQEEQPALTEEESELLGKPITDLELTVRARRALDKLGIKTFGEIVSKTESELLACKNFGITSLTEIKERLSKFGLKLRKID